MKKSILLLLGIAIFITSCKKDDDATSSTPPTTSTTCLITKFADLKDNSYTNVAYISNKVSSVEEFDSTDAKTSSFTTTYSGDKLIRMLMKDSLDNIAQTIEYIYNGNYPDTVYMYMDTNDDGNIDTLYYLYTFTSDKLTSISMYFDIGTGSFTEVSKNEYIWTGDNITENKEYSLNFPNLELSTTTIYEFDSKKNYTHNIGLNYMPMGNDLLNTNNYVKKTVKDASDVIDNASSQDYFNEYDGDKLIKSTIVNFNNDTTEIVQNTYTCN